MDAGLVKGEGFAVDASVMEASASRYRGKAPAEIDWSLPERQTRAVATFMLFGGRYLVRGGKTRSLAGEPPKRVVVLAFDSMERARSWYASPEYQALMPLRDKAGKARIFAVEGLAPEIQSNTSALARAVRVMIAPRKE
jgi:uncharacterized protein (DUF1330 family)